jgi:hypothetical protein
MNIQRSTRLDIAVVVALGAITGVVFPLSAIGVLSFIQKRTSTTPPIDNAARDIADRAKLEESSAKQKELSERLRLLRAMKTTQTVAVECNGTIKYENEENAVEGREYNSEIPVINRIISMDLWTRRVSGFGVSANIYEIDHATIFFAGIDHSNRLMTIHVAGALDGITGKGHVTSWFISHTDIPSSSAKSDLICTPSKRYF